MKQGIITKVSGPLVVAQDMVEARMADVVRVGNTQLIGEIIEIREQDVSIQVYEETGGIGPGEPVTTTGEPLSVELGPGLLTSIYDGIQRPLDVIWSLVGDYITRGIKTNALNREKKWAFVPIIKNGTMVTGGDIIGFVQETELIKHQIMVPPGLEGEIVEIYAGEFTVTEPVARIQTKDGVGDITMMQKWPVRKMRPYKEKLVPNMPLITGQRVIDTFFPIGKGGTACAPGPFGAGKTVIQHQLAKWADAEIIIFIGCGERGNEMTDVLLEFPELIDPKSGKPLMDRTILIANTSNMPVTAREASIYTGVTIAEYFRDMGYSVALMADSTSRWAEALREMSGRLEEMPGEEGYPAYLASRIAGFYERAGRVVCCGSNGREGMLSVIGAVSPPGGDLNDPVVQSTLKVVKVFWSLEDWLAYERHFPAINWLTSYSLYHEKIEEYMTQEITPDWTELRQNAMNLLQREGELKEIVRLVGMDAISNEDRLILETARSIREDFLHQNAFDVIDSYTSFAKQYQMMEIILDFHKIASDILLKGVKIDDVLGLPCRQEIVRMRNITEYQLAGFEGIRERMIEQIKGLFNAQVGLSL
ncbi:V-type ATP synthase subunit A [Candidatus Desantisbacteria bacterium]|nr:V-type ATP synthase subunit A [Candidatus Desantisbacteria bacterium]